MLYLVFGKDYTKIKKETEKIVSIFTSTLEKNKPIVERHTGETIKPEDLLYRAKSNSIFGEKYIYIIESLLGQETDSVLKILESLAHSNNVFIFCEDDVKKDIEKEFIALKSGIVSIKNDTVEKDNPFLITDALLSKDKKKLWMLYRKEVDGGESPESIMGRFIWAIKTLVLINKFPKETASSLGIAPFVYSKTKSAGRVWGPGEPEKFYTEILFGIKSGDEMEYHLEKLILSI